MKGSILKHPLTILGGVAIGILIGLFNTPLSAIFKIENFAQIISLPGQLYLFFLQMTVIPIIMTAIASSLGRLMRNKSSAGLIKRLVVVFVICMIVCAIVGMAAGMFGKPGSGLSENTRALLAKLISSSSNEGMSGILEINLGVSGEVITVARPGLSNFFISLIPSNIFQALSLGSVMAIVFFSIILGIAIGFLPEESAVLLINLFTAIFQAFQKLISWSLYLLPFGLICLLAGQIAAVGVQIFVAMSKFIILYCIGTVVLFVICTLIMWIRSGIRSPLKLFSALFEPILLAFATRNSMATLPSAINCLEKDMKFDSTSVNLTLPLGITLGRFGNIFYFALGVFFVAQIYGMPLLPIHYLIIFVGIIFAGTATAGASGIVTLSMLSIVLDPLNLPMEAVLVIFMAIDPLIDPFRTFLIVYVNMAATTLIAECGKGRLEREISVVEAEIANAERKIQRSVRAKLAGTADESDEKAFEELNKELEKLREEKRRINIGKQNKINEEESSDSGLKETVRLVSGIDTANYSNEKTLTVYIRNMNNMPPLLKRSNGILDGYEISYLKEIGKRLKKKIILKDGIALDPDESELMLQKADIIAGVITETSMPTLPDGFKLSQTWASITSSGIKKPLYFLLHERHQNDLINNVIKTLSKENYLKSLSR